MHMKEITIVVDTDSVAAGDDIFSHQVEIVIPVSRSVKELVDVAKEKCPLASIKGGKATWFVYAGIGNWVNIAVLAHQWESPQFLIDQTIEVKNLFTGIEKSVTFKYWCQASPNAVYDALKSNTELPDRYSNKV